MRRLFPLTCFLFMAWLSCSNMFRSVGILCLVLQVFCATRYSRTPLGFFCEESRFCQKMDAISSDSWRGFGFDVEPCWALVWPNGSSMYAQTLFRLLCLGSLLYGISFFFLHVCHDAWRHLCLRLLGRHPRLLHVGRGGGDRISSTPRILSMNHHRGWSNCPASLILNKEHHSSKSQNI